MEKKLQVHARRQLEDTFLRKSIWPVKTAFISHVSNFDSKFILIKKKVIKLKN